MKTKLTLGKGSLTFSKQRYCCQEIIDYEYCLLLPGYSNSGKYALESPSHGASSEAPIDYCPFCGTKLEHNKDYKPSYLDEVDIEIKEKEKK